MSQPSVEPSANSKPPVARDQFSTEELAVVLSHFDIGGIDAIEEYPRGSRKAPKLLIASDQGRFLLKRRAHGRDDPFKVAFTHAIQLHLARKQFPLPHLIGTRKDNNSMFQWRGSVYELFEFIPGQGYPQTAAAARSGGHTLGLFHKLLLDFAPDSPPPTGSYHKSEVVFQGLDVLRNRVLPQVAQEKELGEQLTKAYRAAADYVEKEGLDTWPRRICHADWHPGNMLYRDNQVVAAIDFDSARLITPVLDIANGALQFAVMYGEADVGQWPAALDEKRYKAFLAGYEEITILSQAELAAVPWLMIEALVAEAILPVAATGTFGRVEGITFLHMVRRKLQWLINNSARLVEIAASNT